MYTGTLIEDLMENVAAAEKRNASAETFRVDVLDKSSRARLCEVPREDERLSD